MCALEASAELPAKRVKAGGGDFNESVSLLGDLQLPLLTFEVLVAFLEVHEPEPQPESCSAGQEDRIRRHLARPLSPLAET